MMTLTLDEIDRIRASFLIVSRDADEAGNMFYQRLFEIAPEARPMFVGEMSAQSAKLMSTLGLVVSQLQSWHTLRPVIEDLAQRHVAYGVRPEHYTAVGRALDRMLGDMLDEAYDEETREAWLRAYGGLADTMIAVAYPDEAERATEMEAATD